MTTTRWARATIQLISLGIFMMLGRAYRIVCLHGSGSSGAKIEQTLQPLLQYLSEINKADQYEFVYPTAPFPKDDGFAWWNMADGERSFNAHELKGISESFAVVENLYPFDCIIGHSQGAMLGSIIAARGMSGDTHIKPAKLILSGAAIPAPYLPLIESLPQLCAKEGGAFAPESLHVIGAQDNVNPVELAKKLADCMQGRTYPHMGGHILPNDPASVNIMAEFLEAR